MFDFNRFETLRAERGVSKAFIAQKLDRAASLCNDWKLGKSTPSEQQIKVVAKILGTSPEYLKGETDKKTPAEAGEGSKYDRIIMEILENITDETKAALIPLLQQMQRQEEAKNGSR